MKLESNFDLYILAYNNQSNMLSTYSCSSVRVCECVWDLDSCPQLWLGGNEGISIEYGFLSEFSLAFPVHAKSRQL